MASSRWEDLRALKRRIARRNIDAAVWPNNVELHVWEANKFELVFVDSTFGGVLRTSVILDRYMVRRLQALVQSMLEQLDAADVVRELRK